MISSQESDFGSFKLANHSQVLMRWSSYVMNGKLLVRYNNYRTY